MGVGRESNHERERADQGAACRRPHHVQGGPRKHTRLLRGHGGCWRGPKRRGDPQAGPRALPRRGHHAGSDAFREGQADPEGYALLPRPPKVVIVTMFESPRYVRGLTGVGASAYLLKTFSSEHLVAAVRAAALDPASENAVVGMPRGMLEGTQDGAESVLSARELEILILAARGLSNHQIASSLYLSEGTVKRHLANVYQKMGVGSRGEASREALLREWITIEEVTAEDEG